MMRLAIQQEIERSDESRYDHRLHGVLLVANGHSCGEVAQLFSEDARTLQRWVGRFEQHGFEGLRGGGRPGRPRRLDEKQWKALARDLRRNPREVGLEQNLWDGKILGEHIKLRYGVALQCQRIFGQLGFRLRKPRPQVAQSDPVKAAAVKNTAPSGKAQGY